MMNAEIAMFEDVRNQNAARGSVTTPSGPQSLGATDRGPRVGRASVFDDSFVNPIPAFDSGRISVRGSRTLTQAAWQHPNSVEFR